MHSKLFTPKFFFITSAIFIAAISRLLPHPPNFTSVGAMALFGGAFFVNKKLAFIIPILAMLISDCILQLVAGIGFHNTMLYVYSSFIIITSIGIYLGKNAKTSNIILASFISSVLFFLITNFGVWASGGMLQGLNGLLNTYVIAIPFFNHQLFGSFFANTILGDLFWCGILFGSFYFAKTKFPVLA